MNRNLGLQHGMVSAPITHGAVPEAGTPVWSRFMVPMRAKNDAETVPPVRAAHFT